MYYALVVRQKRMVNRFSTRNKNTNSILEKTMAGTSNFLWKIIKNSGTRFRKLWLHSTIPVLQFQCQNYDLARFMETAWFPDLAFVQVGIQIVTGRCRLSLPAWFFVMFLHFSCFRWFLPSFISKKKARRQCLQALFSWIILFQESYGQAAEIAGTKMGEGFVWP